MSGILPTGNTRIMRPNTLLNPRGQLSPDNWFGNASWCTVRGSSQVHPPCSIQNTHRLTESLLNFNQCLDTLQGRKKPYPFKHKLHFCSSSSNFHTKLKRLSTKTHQTNKVTRQITAKSIKGLMGIPCGQNMHTSQWRETSDNIKTIMLSTSQCYDGPMYYSVLLEAPHTPYIREGPDSRRL